MANEGRRLGAKAELKPGNGIKVVKRGGVAPQVQKDQDGVITLAQEVKGGTYRPKEVTKRISDEISNNVSGATTLWQFTSYLIGGLKKYQGLFYRVKIDRIGRCNEFGARLTREEMDFEDSDRAQFSLSLKAVDLGLYHYLSGYMQGDNHMYFVMRVRFYDEDDRLLLTKIAQVKGHGEPVDDGKLINYPVNVSLWDDPLPDDPEWDIVSRYYRIEDRLLKTQLEAQSKLSRETFSYLSGLFTSGRRFSVREPEAIIAKQPGLGKAAGEAWLKAYLEWFAFMMEVQKQREWRALNAILHRRWHYESAGAKPITLTADGGYLPYRCIQVWPERHVYPADQAKKHLSPAERERLEAERIARKKDRRKRKRQRYRINLALRKAGGENAVESKDTSKINETHD